MVDLRRDLDLHVAFHGGFHGRRAREEKGFEGVLDRLEKAGLPDDPDSPVGVKFLLRAVLGEEEA